MFKSIRWKFIIVYFLLVFIAMVIVGIFIVREFEEQQIRQTTDSIEEYAKRLVEYSPTMRDNDWEEVQNDIRNILSTWPLPITDRLYILSNSDIPRVISAAPIGNKDMIGKSAYEYKTINSKLILGALKGQKMDSIFPSVDNESNRVKHLAYPVVNERGRVKGIIYITSDLKNISNTIEESKIIFIKATLLALLITVILGFLIARSITGPINDVTVKAEKMAKGDFEQFVEVKSDDEIGQLANMFNYLTEKLRYTISEVFKEKNKMETLFTYMADGLIATDVEGNILHANPVALNILDFTYEDIKNEKFDNIFKYLNEKITLGYISESSKWEGSEIVYIKDLTFKAKYASFKNEKDQIGGIIVVFQDITEQHRLENMRKEFVANVSHELKTPITTIKSYTETLLEGVIDNRELSTQFLNVVNGECDRMARIVRDLLQLSNLDYKQTQWKYKRVSIKELLKSCYMKMMMAAEDKNQTMDIDIDMDTYDVFVDKDGIEQVILNILSNAIKYTHDGGKINITTKNKENQVLIVVKDNGLGIPKEDLERIFERFYRVDKARSRELGGTGLGLSIAKQIVEAQRGRIEINSEYNVGTEVNIILPAYDVVALNQA